MSGGWGLRMGTPNRRCGGGEDAGRLRGSIHPFPCLIRCRGAQPRVPTCSAAHSVSWPLPEPAPGGAERGEGRLPPAPRTIAGRQAGEPAGIPPLAGAGGQHAGDRGAAVEEGDDSYGFQASP